MVKPVEESLEVEYRENKPYKVSKKKKKSKIVVSYKRWLTYNALSFPKIMEIENQTKQTSIKLAVTEFKPGYARNLKISDSFSGKKTIRSN